ncbi:MAG: hypothetical protein AABZ53_14825 [Planctomycetota bacterium]
MENQELESIRKDIRSLRLRIRSAEAGIFLLGVVLVILTVWGRR